MRYIRKGDEPESLANLKALTNEDWKPTYEDDCRGEVKTQLHNALLQEQGYICCYCGMAIAKEDSHIEHLKPRSIYPNLALEFTNIEKLGLDIEKLRLMRSAAIDGALLAIEGLTDEEIQLFSQDFEQLNDQGEYQPFCFVIAYILKQYFVP